MQNIRVSKMLTSVTTTGAGSTAGPTTSSRKTIQATVTGTGAVSATIQVQVSNDSSNWLELGEIVLSGTNSDTDGFATEAPWAYYRGYVSAISGTGATVNLLCGET